MSAIDRAMRGEIEVDHPATPMEACREWAFNVGDTRADECWILHDRDVWMRNPHYVGPPVPHPEDQPENEQVYTQEPRRSCLVGDSRGIENSGNDENCPF